MNKIFHLDYNKFAEIKEKSSAAWCFFPATRIDLWEIPQPGLVF